MGKAQRVLLVSQTVLRGLLGNEEFEVAGNGTDEPGKVGQDPTKIVASCSGEASSRDFVQP